MQLQNPESELRSVMMKVNESGKHTYIHFTDHTSISQELRADGDSPDDPGGQGPSHLSTPVPAASALGREVRRGLSVTPLTGSLAFG